MKVEVIDATKQMFNGETFYLCGYYFQHKSRRLHRVVWEYHNGPIPKGYHIHHIDGDRSNNQLENLLCEPAAKHESDHGRTSERQAYGKMHIERIRPKASEWHGSKAGLEWHSKQGKRNYAVRKVNTYLCTQCGKPFQTKHVYAKGSNHFCGNNCKAKYGRAHRKKELLKGGD